MELLPASDPEGLALLYVQQWLHEQGYTSGGAVGVNHLWLEIKYGRPKYPRICLRCKICFKMQLSGLLSEIQVFVTTTASCNRQPSSCR